jgi:pimeloyl-ACP methyl ester carboxylesterase
MQTLRVNGYDMAYLEVGKGPPLVCVHGTLGDFRTWNAVIGPLSKQHRVIAVSLRHFFPEHWNAVGDDYLVSQHVADVIGFIEALGTGRVDLMGHSRGGHIAFRVAQQRPDLLRRLVLAEPGGELDPSLDLSTNVASHGPSARFVTIAEKIGSGDVEGGLAAFVDTVDGEGGWARLPHAARQQLRDNAPTLIAQVHENRKPYALSEAEAIATPTLLVGGGETTGGLARNWRVLAQHISGAKTALIPGARHWMFDHDPQRYCEIVLDFLAG